jgi:surface carbohydrate biosynthesis protein
MKVTSPRRGATIAIGKRRFRFSRIPRAEILIVSSDTATELAAIFPGRRTYILDIDTRTYFVRGLLECLLRGSLNFSGYIAAVINLSGADLAISLQDNLVSLFGVKPMLRRARIALVQNGQRGIRGDLEGEVAERATQNLSVDYYFTFCDAYADRMRTIMSGNVVVIGSFRSNFTNKPVANRQGISYISTYNPEVPHSRVLNKTSSNESITYQMILDARLAAIRATAHFCTSHGISFSILGKRSDELALAEHHYYRTFLPEIDFAFHPRVGYSTSYRACDLSSIVMSTGSTLGYESLGRGNRTAIFRPDFYMLSDESLRFGWPLEVSEEGPFWSTSSSTRRVHEVLTFLTNVSESEWVQNLSQVNAFVPGFDQGNSVLVRALSEFGARSIPHH